MPRGSSRRWMLAGLGALVATPAAAQSPATPRDLSFRVSRKGSHMGSLRVGFTREADRLIARTRVELSVHAAFLRVFHYTHDSIEIWRGEQLLSLQAETSDDGQRYSVRATPQGGNLKLEGPAGTRAVPPHSLTSNSVWHPAFVRQRNLIDCEKARFESLTVEPLGQRPMPVLGMQRLVTGHRITVSHARGEVWHDQAGEWVHSVFQTKGETLTYDRDG
ncbi:MAG: DUF6134 family protein [Reyranellaceae bacterium]